MGSEDLSGEVRGEPGGPQPAESKDDVETRRDFWSIQCDFICRHHIEPGVQLHVPKEETFPISLKCIDVTRVSYNKNLQRDMWSGRRLTKIKQLPDLGMCGLKYGQSRSKERKARMGKREAQTRQCSKVERHFSSIRKMENMKKPSKTRGESWKFQWMRQCFARMEQKKHFPFQETEAKSCECASW